MDKQACKLVLVQLCSAVQIMQLLLWSGHMFKNAQVLYKNLLISVNQTMRSLDFDFRHINSNNIYFILYLNK